MKYALLAIVLYSYCAMISCQQNNVKNETATNDTAKMKAVTPNDLLPSWNDGSSKNAIIGFVTRVTKEGSKDFIPESQRIACFDNDGTLWSEQPLYFQIIFALDRIKEMAPKHPEWKTKEPFKSVMDGNLKQVLRNEKALDQIVAITSAGMSSDQYDSTVKKWINTAKHPRFNQHYNDLIYQPMIELLNYLRANNFKTYIVSGGDEAFMRVWAEPAYGIPPEQIVGSSMQIQYLVKKDTPVIMRMPALNFMDDGAGKPIGIMNHIGIRPVFTAGNSDGDYQMLQYTSTGSGPRFGMIVHHTDSAREWAYDSTSAIGHLQKGLEDAPKYGWVVVDMKHDWKVIYPFDKK